MNKYLEKIAEMQKQAMTDETKKELGNTGIIAATGTVGSALGTAVGKKLGVVNHVGKMALLGGGIGLAADYGAVKLMSRFNNKFDKSKGV